MLAHPEVQLAVTETARGGILLKGIGLTRNDVSVVTNVSADHLGLQGIDTVDQLAEVKAVVPQITRKDGWAVLNADDPRVFAMRSDDQGAAVGVLARPRLAGAPRGALDGGRATTVIDGWICVLMPDADPDPLVELVDVPMTLAGLSRFNVENALAAASAALAVGIPREVVVEGLRTFRPDAEHNPGRMNVFSVAEATSRSSSTSPTTRPGSRRCWRSWTAYAARLPAAARARRRRGPHDDLIERLGEIGARDSDVVAIGHKEHYLRGRTAEELDGLLRAGAERVGVTDMPAYPTEVDCLAALVEQARPATSSA